MSFLFPPNKPIDGYDDKLVKHLMPSENNRFGFVQTMFNQE